MGLLTVIAPDDRRGMQQMLERELQGIDSEIIYESWEKGLAKAKSDFVCLLEHDSAVNKGAIARQLQPFLDNPRYRKLAMVSPKVEFEDSEPLFFSQTEAPSSACQLARIGCIGGAVVRRSSLKRHLPEPCFDLIDGSYVMSIAFWEHGLRIMRDPSSVYYSPLRFARTLVEVPDASHNVRKIWQRECIA